MQCRPIILINEGIWCWKYNQIDNSRVLPLQLHTKFRQSSTLTPGCWVPPSVLPTGFQQYSDALARRIVRPQPRTISAEHQALNMAVGTILWYDPAWSGTQYSVASCGESGEGRGGRKRGKERRKEKVRKVKKERERQKEKEMERTRGKEKERGWKKGNWPETVMEHCKYASFGH